MLEPARDNPLPAIPDKRYFAIGEVSRLCALKPHVLRYWEQEFPQLNPVKRRGNRRYYRQEDVLTIRQIRALLYDEGYTIDGARQRMNAEQTGGAHRRSGIGSPGGAPPAPIAALITEAIAELEQVLKLLKPRR